MQFSGTVLAAFFLLELFFLALISKKLIQSIYLLFIKVTHKHEKAVKLLALLLLPGTFIHELSHFLMAKLLWVHTSGMEFKPVVHSDGVKLGSVSIARTDFLRRLLIGGAPFIFGLSLILGSLAYFYSNFDDLITFPWWVFLILLVIYFEIGNTMFSSKKDLQGALAVLIFLFLFFIFLYFVSWHQPFVFLDNFLNLNRDAILIGCLLLGVPIAINTLLLLIFKLFR
jgi:hypothetical protein